MCCCPYPLREIEYDPLEELILEQEIASFDEEEMKLYNLFCDDDDEYDEDIQDTIRCILESHYCNVILSFE